MPFPKRTHWKLTWRSAATWALVFVLCGKGILLYEMQHPDRTDLIQVAGHVAAIHRGGEGSATWLDVAGPEGTRRYGSWFGQDWPGMERIRPGDRVSLLAERNRLSGTSRVESAPFYFWQLVHQGRVIVTYEQVSDLVNHNESAISHWADILLLIAMVWFVIAWVAHLARRRS